MLLFLLSFAGFLLLASHGISLGLKVAYRSIFRHVLRAFWKCAAFYFLVMSCLPLSIYQQVQTSVIGLFVRNLYEPGHSVGARL